MMRRIRAEERPCAPLRSASDEERALGEAYGEMALRLGRAVAQRYHSSAEAEILSAAGWELHLATQSYRTREGIAFATYARHRIVLAAHRAGRRETGRGPKGVTVRALADDPVAIDPKSSSGEDFERLLGLLEERDAALLRLHYAGREKIKDIASHLGLSRRQVERDHARSLREIGAAIGSREALCA